MHHCLGEHYIHPYICIAFGLLLCCLSVTNLNEFHVGCVQCEGLMFTLYSCCRNLLYQSYGGNIAMYKISMLYKYFQISFVYLVRQMTDACCNMDSQE